jgi:hypothetical protein
VNHNTDQTRLEDFLKFWKAVVSNSKTVVLKDLVLKIDNVSFRDVEDIELKSCLVIQNASLKMKIIDSLEVWYCSVGVVESVDATSSLRSLFIRNPDNKRANKCMNIWGCIINNEVLSVDPHCGIEDITVNGEDLDLSLRPCEAHKVVYIKNWAHIDFQSYLLILVIRVLCSKVHEFQSGLIR